MSTMVILAVLASELSNYIRGVVVQRTITPSLVLVRVAESRACRIRYLLEPVLKAIVRAETYYGLQGRGSSCATGPVGQAWEAVSPFSVSSPTDSKFWAQRVIGPNRATTPEKRWFSQSPQHPMSSRTWSHRMRGSRL